MEKLTSIAGTTVLCAGTVAVTVWCAIYVWDKTQHARNTIYRWSKRVASRRGLNAIRYGIAARVLRPLLDVRAEELKTAGAGSYTPLIETPEAAQRRHDATVALSELHRLYKAAMDGGTDTAGRPR